MIKAELRYCVDTGVKPVTETVGPGGRLRRRTGRDDPRLVEIADARARDGELSLEREGFVLVHSPTEVRDFWDPEQRNSLYNGEIQALIANLSGAARVEVFDHTLRSTRSEMQERHHAREPVHVVHNDYSERSGPWRVEDLLPDEAPGLLRRRVAIIQVWRPILAPVLDEPLALCAADSVAPEDFIAAERRHPHRVGEIYQLRYNPEHRWSYFPAMTADEAIVFKVYDSEADGRARFTPHSSFSHPGAPEGAVRESIEVRALAFFC